MHEPFLCQEYFLYRMKNKTWLLVLFTCVSYVHSMNENMTKTKLLPGVIKKYEGEVFFVKDYLAVAIDHTHTLEIPKDLKRMLKEVDNIGKDLKKLNDSADTNDQKLIAEINTSNDIVESRLLEALGWFPNFHDTTRNKRGLINIVGIGLKYLFGVLAQGDLDKLEDKLANLQDLKDRDHKVIEGLTSKAEKQRVKINQIIDQLNEANKHINELIDRSNMQSELHYIAIFINNMHKEVDYMIDEVRHSIDDLSLASKGIVTSNVISMNDMSMVLHEAKLTYHLEPIFNSRTLAYYYTVMEVLFAPSTVILQIPMSSEYTFHHFKFIPFPTFHKNETLILSENNTDLLIQDNLHHIAETIHTSFAKCRKVSDLKICPSNLLPLKSSLTYESCLKNLYFAPLTMDSLCTYVEVELTDISVLLEDQKVFVTRTHNSPARIECGEERTVTRDRTFSVELNCQVSDSNMIILGTNSYSMKIDTEKETYIHRYIGSSFNHTNRTVILRLVKENETTHFISQDTLKVVIPSVSITGSAMFIFITILCVYIKICKKYNLKRQLRRKPVNVIPQCSPNDKSIRQDRSVEVPKVRKGEDSQKREKSTHSRVRHETIQRKKTYTGAGNFIE